LIDADVEVDFAPPLDYVEDVPSLIKKQSSVNLDDEEDSMMNSFHSQARVSKLTELKSTIKERRRRKSQMMNMTQENTDS